MWYGGSVNKQYSKSHFTVYMFINNIYYGNTKKPDNVSQERWDAMYKWLEARKCEGLTLQNLLSELED